MAARGPRPRRVPRRTCIACRQIQDKITLIRIVRTATGVVIDRRGKLSGRGAYLHACAECWERGLASRGQRSLLEQALKTRLSAEEKQCLEEYRQELSRLTAGSEDGSVADMDLVG